MFAEQGDAKECKGIQQIRRKNKKDRFTQQSKEKLIYLMFLAYGF